MATIMTASRFEAQNSFIIRRHFVLRYSINLKLIFYKKKKCLNKQSSE